MYAHVALSMYAHMWLLPLYLSIPLYIPQDAPPLSVFYCRPVCFLLKNQFFALGRFAFVLFCRSLGRGYVLSYKKLFKKKSRVALGASWEQK